MCVMAEFARHLNKLISIVPFDLPLNPIDILINSTCRLSYNAVICFNALLMIGIISDPVYVIWFQFCAYLEDMAANICKFYIVFNLS